MKKLLLVAASLSMSLLLTACSSSIENTENSHEKSEVETPDEKAERIAKEVEERKLALRKQKEETDAKMKIEEEKAKVEAEAKAKAEEEAKAKAEVERLAKLEALKISGKGDTATNKFNLDSGIVIIDVSHKGNGHFALKLLDSKADMVDLVANEIGLYNGKKLLFVDEGEYQFNVSADGDWNIQMSQEIADEEIITGSAKGKGDSVIFMDLVEGANTFIVTHDGENHFAVKINDHLLINKIGPYNGSQIQKIEKTGIYGFNIYADGNWTITVE